MIWENRTETRDFWIEAEVRILRILNAGAATADLDFLALLPPVSPVCRHCRVKVFQQEVRKVASVD